ncbi:type VII secretion protein EccE [Streptomyces hilarionis]|uniref:type VII secretion protein EccE n=1 Tax=Streptomyces hilarionis TaxID=2839954 RepID=UPI00211AA200|nr:type VII secretion protein EccE [Streptomyces hilarionis]MCQ9133358.1 type VII secretion protein EccE [Streptomyces hilarionis]
MASATGVRSAGRSRTGSSPAAGPLPPGQPSAPGALRARGGAGRGRSFRLQRLVLVEIAAALLLVGWVSGPAVLPAAAIPAVVLVVLAFARRRGRSLPEWLATARELKARRRRAGRLEIPPGTEPGFGPAVECDPGLRTYVYGGRDRRPVGLVGDGTFVTVVLQVEADATAMRAPRDHRPLPLALVRDALEVDGIRLESAQIVLHTQPAPALHLPPQSVAVANYLPLQEQTGAPAVRITWIALKLDPERCPQAVAVRGGGLIGAQKCAVRAADHLASRLTGAGFRATVLNVEELTTAIATSACANPLVTAEAGRTGQVDRRTEETSRSWRCDNRRHTTYWLHRWPASGAGGPSLPQFVALITAVPALATTFSVTLAHGDRQEMSLTGHVRVTGRSDDELVAVRRAVQGAARHTGAGLARLDREQVPGMLATLPLGGAR